MRALQASCIIVLCALLMGAACTSGFEPEASSMAASGAGGASSASASGAGTADASGGYEHMCPGFADIACYGGPPNTEGVGVCVGGTQKVCIADGTPGGGCEGQVVPSDEVCDGLDNDCDGQVDVVACCSNGVKDGEEMDIDCGGPLCAPCAEPCACASDADCPGLVCKACVCLPPTCRDGVVNGAETGVDCGGDDCLPCGGGQPCKSDQDCLSKVCTSGVCE